jgi:hypothetical protein
MSHDDARHREELTALRDRIDDGEFDALDGALAALEAAGKAAGERGPEAYRDLFETYYEPFADGLDRLARAEGWPVLAEFIEAYDPRTTETFPRVSAVVENAVGRFVVRTRFGDGVDAIPAEALAYLRAVPPACPSDAGAAFDEAATYGWGIGHPEEAVADHVHDMADEHRYWASATLEVGLRADQAAAVDLLGRIVTDDEIDFAVPHSLLVPGAERFFLATAAGAEAGRDPGVPRFWDWQAEYDYTFEWDPDVEARVRELARETGVADDLPENWTLGDLAI